MGSDVFRAPGNVRAEARRLLSSSVDDERRRVAQSIVAGRPVNLDEVAVFAQNSPETSAVSAWSKKIQARSVAQPEEGDMADLVVEVPDLREELSELFADVFSFYLRAQGAHWNVTGADFAEYHALFGAIYADVYDSVDPLAENIRKVGALAPFRLPELVALRSIADGNVGQDARALAADLLVANDTVIAQIAEAFECATMCGQQGIANFLADRMDAHQTWKWQLSASLGTEVASDVVVVEDEPDDVVEDAPEEEASGERASAARLGVGTWVSWTAADGTRVRGKIEKVVTKGAAQSSDGYELSAVDGDPVFVVRLYEMSGNGWIPSDRTFVQRADLFTVTGALASPRCAEDEAALEVRRIPKDVETRTYHAELRAVGESNTVRGYAATWNTEASGLSFREAIAPGAFTRSLASGDDVFLLVNHDDRMIPLARRSSGTLRIAEDQIGLGIEADLDPENPIAAGLLSALRRGDVDKMSFAFRVAPGGEQNVDGVRMLTDVDLYEVSIVTWPAYDSTSVGVRSESASSDTRRRRLSMLLAQQG